MQKLHPLFDTLRAIGVSPAPLLAADTAHVVGYGNRLISQRAVPGLKVTAEGGDAAIRIQLTVAQGAVIEQPVHLCLGLFEPTGDQRVILQVRLEADSRAQFLAHCLFSQPVAATHEMAAAITLAEGAQLRYSETHFHGQSGGIEVRPRARIQLGKGAQLFSDFALVAGRVGLLDVDFDVEVGENAVTELTSKVYGRGTDRIRIYERIVLAGANARGLVKSRIAAADDATAEVIGITEGNAPGARGHVDCLEIVRDRAVVSANPLVKVSHPQAKVTHEAAIGSVDRQQLETLMARGMAPEAAVDLIVSGLLRQA